MGRGWEGKGREKTGMKGYRGKREEGWRGEGRGV